jgi:hypothetical protein
MFGWPPELKKHCDTFADPMVFRTNTTERHGNVFPPPWTIEELNACFGVRDHNGQKLAYESRKFVCGVRIQAK